MSFLTTNQIGRLLILLRDTEITLNDLVKTNLIKDNEDIWNSLVSEFIDRVDKEEKEEEI